jgi:cytochrome b subunit of formate dehydrogenase
MSRTIAWIISVAILTTGFAGLAAAQGANPENAQCLACHGNADFAAPRADGQNRSLHVAADRFEQSVHGKILPCVACHSDITEVPHKNVTATRADMVRKTPEICGQCHAKLKDEYVTSVHGDEVVWKRNASAATCVSCHTAHYVVSPKTDPAQLALVRSCGACHKENLKSYLDTYHGQVTALGSAYTAKCYDCHAGHTVQRVTDPSSTVHPSNRLNTCRKCHANATAGFVTFQPHANTHDFDRYPAMWITAKFMMALIIGVFLFFWTHCALWFYREYRDRKEGKTAPHVKIADLPNLKGKYFRRFGPWWRLAHLLFALALMTLSLTGMAVFYAESAWAAAVMKFIGGPRAAATIHRVAAVLILTIFFAQLIYFIVRLAPRWRTFKWFGHTSLVPSLQDLKDMIAMFRWFFGKGPRPVFGRWSYWERFDYWAPFWGLTIVGGSGIMLWFKEATAAVWPGWMFNVAALAHGEEAFLAIVFLFTVHFFNNHFRPDKLPPPDIVMFTGAVSLEEFAREHTIEYEELLRSGQLEKYLVNAPSPQMTLASRILGIVLLGFGLALLTLVLIGFVGELRTA